MAARKTKKEEVLVNESVNKNDILTTTNKICLCTTSELLEYLKAVDSLCQFYDRSVRLYDGSISDSNSQVSMKVAKLMTVRNSVLEELEKRLFMLE